MAQQTNLQDVAGRLALPLCTDSGEGGGVPAIPLISRS